MHVRLTPCRDFLPTACFLPLTLLHHVVEVVWNVEVGELLCDSLKDAPDATLLRFAISSTEVRAEYQVFSRVILCTLNCQRCPSLACYRRLTDIWACPGRFLWRHNSRLVLAKFS